MLGFPFGVLHSMGLTNVCCIHHCSIIQNIFIDLGILCDCLSSLVPSSLATIALFTVSIVLSFPKCHIVGIV